MSDFPCPACRDIASRFDRYHPQSWAWDNVLIALRQHEDKTHRDVSSIARQEFLHSVTTERGHGRQKEEGS